MIAEQKPTLQGGMEIQIKRADIEDLNTKKQNC